MLFKCYSAFSPLPTSDSSGGHAETLRCESHTISVRQWEHAQTPLLNAALLTLYSKGQFFCSRVYSLVFLGSPSWCPSTVVCAPTLVTESQVACTTFTLHKTTTLSSKPPQCTPTTQSPGEITATQHCVFCPSHTYIRTYLLCVGTSFW